MKAFLLGGAALLVVAAAPVSAQSNANSVAQTGTPQADTPEQPRGPSETSPAEADIVVTGIRASLRSSLATKRNAENIVDSITAEDTGKFPDNNVAESLQRITGVAIDRSGGEGQFITVRGLGPEFNTVLVNGRIMATENAGREFSFDVLSSNMIQRTDVYKSSLPQLQEGGIGATVNVVTARPLDGKTGFHVAGAAGGIYDGLADELSPDVSGVVSWTNDNKTFGAVLSASYTDRKSQRDFVDINGWIQGPQNRINASPTATGLTEASLSPPGDRTVFNTPRNLNFNREAQRRERLNIAGAVQAQINEAALLTVDGIYSKFDVKNVNRFFGIFYTEPFIGLTQNANGTVTGFNRPGTRFVAANPALNSPALGQRQVTASQNDNIVTPSQRLTESYQFGANMAVDLSDSLTMKFDGSTTKAVSDQPRQFLVVGSLAQTSPRFDLTPELDLPTASNLGPITDANLLRAHYGLNEFIRVRDKGSEFHIDGEWKVDNGIFRKMLFGMAYNRRQKTRTLANNEDTVCTYCGYDIPIPTNLVTPYALDGFLNKASGRENVPTSFFTFDPAAVFAYISQPAILALPRQGRNAAAQRAEAARVLALAGGPYGLRNRPGQSLNVTEKVAAAYVAADFGGDNWSANVGARLVDTKLVSSGFGQSVLAIRRNEGDDNLVFTFSDPQPVSIRNSYTNILPSANIKYEIDSRALLRAAVSQTLTRPTLTSLGTDNFYTGRVTNATSGGGNPALRPFRSTNYDVSLEYYLSDVSYLSISGFYKQFTDFLESQTLTAPLAGVVLPPNLAGLQFQDTRTRNGQSGSITGVEIGAQYSFEQLPGLLSGFGVAGNYTYVSSNVVRSAATDTQCGYSGLSPHSANGSIFYEKFGLQARTSYNWRSSFLRNCFGAASRPENRESYGQLDASIAYDITPEFQVYLQGVNLTSAYVRDYSLLQERFMLLQNTGSRYLFGVRARF